VRRSKRPIIIASRKSKLARAQAQAVGRALSRMHPSLELRYEWIESEGDRAPTRPLGQFGLKGAFTGAVERALLEERADIAVHSMKDLPTEGRAGLTVAALPKRGDVRDCLITKLVPDHIHDFPDGAVFGTSSPRRAAQVQRIKPSLRIKPLRGNVESRLFKIINPLPDAEHFDATLLAVAGLQRAGLSEYAALPISPDVMLPAAAQGALGVQCRADDHVTISRCLPLNDPTTASLVTAERHVIAGLQGDCHSPIGVLAETTGRGVRLRVRVLSSDGAHCIQDEIAAPEKTLGKATEQLIKRLRDQGSDTLIRGGVPKPSGV